MGKSNKKKVEPNISFRVKGQTNSHIGKQLTSGSVDLKLGKWSLTTRFTFSQLIRSSIKPPMMVFNAGLLINQLVD